MDINFFAHAGMSSVDAMGFNGAVIFNDLWTLLHSVGLMLLIFTLTTSLTVVRLARANAKFSALKPLLHTLNVILPITLGLIWITGVLWACAFIAGGFVYDWLLIVADIYVIISVISLLHTWKLHTTLYAGITPGRKFYAGSSVNMVLLTTILVLDIFKPSMSIALIICLIAFVIAILTWQIIADRNVDNN